MKLFLFIFTVPPAFLLQCYTILYGFGGYVWSLRLCMLAAEQTSLPKENTAYWES